MGAFPLGFDASAWRHRGVAAERPPSAATVACRPIRDRCNCRKRPHVAVSPDEKRPHCASWPAPFHSDAASIACKIRCWSSMTLSSSDSRRFIERGRALSSLTVKDPVAYRAFLRHPTPRTRWIGPARPRSSPEWRPFFAGSLSARPVRGNAGGCPAGRRGWR
jgi:hypothetical protein